jgi:hypothetical protein
MAMFEKIILCATSTQMTAGVWRFGKLHAYHVYQNNNQGHQEFSQFLQQHRNTKIYLLADAVEEDYRVESLPHTAGSARRELVERKLGQLYRGVAYRAAHFMSRDKDKRKDDRFLFLSLNNADFLQGWIACIEAQEAPLVGVYLLSMVSQALAKQLKLASPHMLLAERLNSGLRQTYLHDARLRISRLAPIPSAMLDRLGYFYLVETEKTRLYLMSQRFISKETALKMVLLSLDEGDQQICRAIEQEHGMACESVNITQFARSLKLTPSQLKQNPELLHMHLLAIGNVPINLAPASLDKHYKLNSIRAWINAASAAILVAGIAVSGWQIKQSMDQSELLDQAALDTRSQEQRYNEVAKNFPVTPISGADLQQAVALNKSIRAYAKAPKRMMQIVSAALETTPEIQINRLHWLQTNDTDLKDEDKAWASPVVTAATATKSQSAFKPDPIALYEIGFINGELKGFKGDYRAALNTVNRFAERLKTDAAIEQVEILQAPVNVSSYSDLQGTTTDEMAAQSAAALFKLRIILKREVPPT